MKHFFFLLLFTTGILNATAQTHFITAGQTQGMMFTDYVPDLTVSIANSPGIDSTFLDINNDSIPDISIVSSFYWAGGMGHFIESHSLSIHAIRSDVELIAKNDSTSCGSTVIAAVTFDNGDTILNESNYIYTYNPLIHYTSSGNGWCSYSAEDGGSDTSFFAGRMIANNDTLLFYIHFSGIKVLDYAIEGQDTSLTISSINDLSNHNSITVYPNPFTSSITTSYNKAFEYQLTDYSGRVVQQGKTEKNISTDKLAAGNYLLLMKNEELYSMKRIVKMKE